ncbi:heavy metal-binding domain-containing protein, partial [Desulfosarcina sp.]|uniref:heavy metal-binding domain-containing protein n=1 Tax=Desulfosarcina sp. TaxID=2027861 RepID=UPI003970EA5E
MFFKPMRIVFALAVFSVALNWPGAQIQNRTFSGAFPVPATVHAQDALKAGMVDPKTGKTIKYWVAPMDPTYIRDEPGKSPMGMDLVPVYAEEDGE